MSNSSSDKRTFILSGLDWKERGAALGATIPSSMLPLNVDAATHNFRRIYALDSDLELEVDKRRRQGRIHVFTSATRICNPLELVGKQQVQHVVSRAAWKLNEIMHDHWVGSGLPAENVNVACICEAPGGFVQACGGVLGKRLGRFLIQSLPETKNGVVPAFDEVLVARLDRENDQVRGGRPSTLEMAASPTKSLGQNQATPPPSPDYGGRTASETEAPLRLDNLFDSPEMSPDVRQDHMRNAPIPNSLAAISGDPLASREAPTRLDTLFDSPERSPASNLFPAMNAPMILDSLFDSPAKSPATSPDYSGAALMTSTSPEQFLSLPGTKNGCLDAVEGSQFSLDSNIAEKPTVAPSSFLSMLQNLNSTPAVEKKSEDGPILDSILARMHADASAEKKMSAQNPHLVIRSSVLEPQCRHSLYQKAAKNKWHLVTADGGTVSQNPHDHALLAAAQMVIALHLLEAGGMLVLKMLDLFESKLSPVVLWIAHECFEEVELYKPLSSRPANTEVYLHARGKRDLQGITTITELELWLCRICMEVEQKENLFVIMSCPSPLVLPDEFMYLVQMAHFHFGKMRQARLRQALEITKVIVTEDPMMNTRSLKRLQGACERSPQHLDFASRYEQDYPLLAIQDANVWLQQFPSSVGDLLSFIGTLSV